MPGALTPPALGCRTGFRPVQVLSCTAVRCLQLVEPRGKPLGAPSNHAIRPLAFGILYFFVEVRPPAHCRASAHFFSLISRAMLARDLGRGSERAPSSHSTPRVSGSSAASLAHSSAFSFPSTPSCAGHHLFSMVMSGTFLQSMAMCSLASSAYFCPGPGSSDAILRTAAWASVNMVT